jgi:hypothetical protein
VPTQDKKAGNGQYIHAKAQPLVETALARLRVGIGGRDCQQARFGLEPGQVPILKETEYFARHRGEGQVQVRRLALTQVWSLRPRPLASRFWRSRSRNCALVK